MFRISQSINKIHNRYIRTFLKIVFTYTIFRFLSIFFGIEINIEANIGKGFYIGHSGGIHIGPVEMGEFCNVSHGVTIGLGRMETDRYGLPALGDHVFIGPGAMIFGNIKIGSNVSIGANAVVSKDIPDYSIVVGNPGRIIGYQDKNIMIHNQE